VPAGSFTPPLAEHILVENPLGGQSLTDLTLCQAGDVTVTDTDHGGPLAEPVDGQVVPRGLAIVIEGGTVAPVLRDGAATELADERQPLVGGDATHRSSPR